MTGAIPLKRQRRLRKSPAIRDLVRETSVSVDNLIQPIFVEEDIAEFVDIPSMPGVRRVPEQFLAREITQVAEDGVKAVILFGISHSKDGDGSDT